MSTHIPIVDFHSHYFDPAWGFEPPASPGFAPRVWPLLTDLDGQLAALDSAGIDAKVLTAPSANLVPAAAALDPGRIREINDTFAGLVAAQPSRLDALGTIDAFQGEAAAREVERVVRQLGFGGIVIDCAQGELLLDAPEARPALEAAAALGALVFVHPVSPAALPERLARLGSSGVLLARGQEDAASVLALLRSGLLDELPELRIVIPAIGASALFFAPFADREFGPDSGREGTLPSEARKRLYIDTMGLDPALIRYAVNLLGIEHVLFGTDWPIMPPATRERITTALATAGLTGRQEQAAILSGNLLRLLNGSQRQVVPGEPVQGAAEWG